MTTITLLVEWAIRSSILILGGWLLLRALRVRDASIKLAAWTAMLGGSLAIPVLTAVLPQVHLAMPRWETVRPEAVRSRPPPAPPVEAPREGVSEAAPAPMALVSRPDDRVPSRFDWALVTVTIYLLVAGAMLLRLFAGLAMSLRLLRTSRATGQATHGIAIRESDRVAAPVTLGMARPAIVLPADWREWSGVKLEGVLVHERSHVRRLDPAVQFVSVIHRALLWHSPLSWFLHKRIVRAAEEASDDAAVAATHDRASYAEALLDFMRQGVRGENWQGVAMARYDCPEERIHRILDGTALSRGVTRWSVVAILALGSPLAYVVATAKPQAQAPLAQAPRAVPSTATQPTATLPAFDVADVQASAYTAAGLQAGFGDGRYELRHATMLDLIKTAYGVDADTVSGGPSWLEFDRFDVIAKAPPSASPETVKLMLQSLLADRFKLVVHKDTKPMPAFVLSVGKGKPKLKEADGSGEPGCQNQPQDPQLGAAPSIAISCRNMTMEAFAQSLRGYSFGYITNPVVDATGLEGAWDFDIKWTPQVYLPRAGGEGITLFDAVDKQLGLKLGTAEGLDARHRRGRREPKADRKFVLRGDKPAGVAGRV
jgi:uncharacterized protein (TIGR03435 family)